MHHLAMTLRTRVGRLAASLRPSRDGARLRLGGAVLLAASLAVLGSLVLTGSDDTAPVGIGALTRNHPDVVVILTDDQRTDTLLSMPSVRRLLVDRGTRFTNAHVPNSLCCPSRSTLLTGLYSGQTGVWGNGNPDGGWPAFVRNGNEKKTIALTLQRAGYRTGLIGKYLNAYGHYAPANYHTPGWSDFEAFRVPNQSGAYYDYLLGNSQSFHGLGGSNYSTDVLARRAVNYIWSTPQDKSLFLYFAPYAPHLPATPAPRYVGALKGKVPTYRPLSADASLKGKPAWMQGSPPLPQSMIEELRETQGESLMAVDDAVAAIVAALQHSDRLRDTMIVFMSDNGYLNGEHRLVGKNVPYQQATSVPLVIRWDGRIRAGAVDDRLTGNIDIAATIAEAAGTPMHTSGLSLLDKTQRTGLLLEALRSKYNRPPYCGWRTHDWLFVHYATGEEELYSVPNDREELNNLADDPSYDSVLASLRAQSKRACNPMPPGFQW
jgi:N-acetylglucosamine-6-sulfatase